MTHSTRTGPWPVPEGWEWVRALEVATVVGGGTPSTADPSNFDGGTIPWITPADLSGYSQKFISSGARSITRKGLESSGAQLIPEGSVLMSSRAPIGYVAIAARQLTTNQGFKSFVLKPVLSPDFVYYYLHRAKELAVSLASGTTFLELSKRRAETLPMPIPPLAEQRRIVEAIETRFARLDGAVRALERARANLKRYRGAVLSTVFEGPLPSAWTISSIADVVKPTVSQEGPDGTGSFTYVDIGSVDNRTKQIVEPTLVPIADKPSRARQRLVDGDVIVSMTRPNLNAVAIVPEKLRGSIGSTGFDVLRARTVDPRWLFLVVQTPAFVRAMTARVQGALYPAVRPSDIRAFSFPVAPRHEQSRIIAEVERALSIVGETAANIEHSLRRCQYLRESVLKYAFEGRLVAQDPKDEPASALLERIKTANPASSKPVRRARRLLLAE